MQSLIEHARNLPSTIAVQQLECADPTRGQRLQAPFIACCGSRGMPPTSPGGRDWNHTVKTGDVLVGRPGSSGFQPL